MFVEEGLYYGSPRYFGVGMFHKGASHLTYSTFYFCSPPGGSGYFTSSFYYGLGRCPLEIAISVEFSEVCVGHFPHFVRKQVRND